MRLEAAAFALVSALAGRAGATPAALFGPGPASIALAGGGTSRPLGAEAVLLNPGELAQTPRKSLMFGLRASEFALSFDARGASHGVPVELSKGLLIGVAAPLVPPSPDGWRAGFGLFAQTPPDFLVRAHLPLPEQPSFPLLVGRASALDLGVGLGLGYGPVALGAGVEVLATLSGRDAVAGTGGAVAGIGDELLPAWGPAVGVRAELGPVGELGVTVHGVLRADFDVNVAAATLAGVIGIAPLNVQGIAHYEPFKVDAELSRRLGPLMLLAGARYERWSDFPGWVARTIECPEGVPCGTSAPPPPGYVDVLVPRIALEHTFETARFDVTARAGYSFVPSAIPEQRGSGNTFDADRHALSAGYRVRLTRSVPLEVEGALRLDLLASRTHHKLDGARSGPLGPEVTTHGSIVTWAFGVRGEL